MLPLTVNIILVDAIHFIAGSILIIIAMRAFLKTRIHAMLYLTVGFTLITVGHLFADLYYFENLEMNRLIPEILDILGLIALIIAIHKS